MSVVALINVHGRDRDPQTVRNYGDWVWYGPRAEVDRVVQHLLGHHEIAHVLGYGGELRVSHENDGDLTPAEYRGAEQGVRCRLEDGARARREMWTGADDAVMYPDGSNMLPMFVPGETAPHAFQVIQLAAQEAERIWSLIKPPEPASESSSVRSEAVAMPTGVDGNVFRLSGNMWEVRYGDERGHFSDQKGFQILHRLLQFPNPSRPLSAAELQGVDPEAVAADAGRSPQVVVDAEALKGMREAMRDAEQELATAERNNDEAGASRARQAMDELKAQIKRATALGGAARTFNSKSVENAVRQSVKRARGGIAETMPRLAEHLVASITIAADCAYRPRTSVVWEL